MKLAHFYAKVSHFLKDNYCQDGLKCNAWILGMQDLQEIHISINTAHLKAAGYPRFTPPPKQNPA